MVDLAALAERARDNPTIRGVRDTQEDLPNFSKWAAYYVQSATIPGATCRNCIWWTPPEESESGEPDCTLVDRLDEPDEGRIDPEATCNLWNSSPARLRLIQVARGRGDEDGLLPGVLRTRIEEALISPPHTRPPGAVVDNVLLPIPTPNIPTELQGDDEGGEEGDVDGVFG